MAAAPVEGQRPGFGKIWELDRPDAAHFPAFNDLLRAFGSEHPHEARVLRAHRYASLRELSRLGYGELPDAFVHCDYHHDNLLFRGGELTGLLDFDFLHRDARVVDIAWAIVLDCLEPPAHNAISPASVAAFVGGYHAESPLDETERTLIVPLSRSALVAGAAMRLRQWEDGPKELRLDAPRSVRRTVEQRLPAFESRRTALEQAVVDATSV
jgi:homoserine kinase type II